MNAWSTFDAEPKGVAELVAGPTVLAQASCDSAPEIAATLARVAAASFIDGVETEKAQKLALRYQLLTDATNFVLVHVRDAGEKAREIPELRKISQMVPAGWGGMGVRGVRSASPLVRTNAVMSIAIPDETLNSPFEESTNVSMIDAVGESALLSLRLAMRSGVRVATQSFEIDRSDPQLWSQSESYVGLTPKGLKVWLESTSAEGWPKTYDALLDIGIGMWVVDWLAIEIGRDVAEHDAVAAFLCVMMQGAYGFSNDVPAVQEIVRCMGKNIRSSEMDHWPLHVFFL